MTWWLRLYPKRWRERYGQEFAALIQDRGWSLATGYDVLRSMLDAWLHPDLRPIQRLPARASPAIGGAIPTWSTLGKALMSRKLRTPRNTVIRDRSPVSAPVAIVRRPQQVRTRRTRSECHSQVFVTTTHPPRMKPTRRPHLPGLHGWTCNH